ncbi:MAG TPA: glycosyltransferase family A protein [Gemmatimonadaceae bacterium]|nr:glycosyltransferase family A protein [Gemmatimonadaceae bacterium]
MTELTLSAIIPTYNRAHLVGRAIRSVLASVRPTDEILVVDDGSTDDTERVVRAFGERVTYVRSSNGGAGRARNIGVSLAKHPLVAFLDSDDEWIPGELEWKRRILEARDDVLFCFSDFLMQDEQGIEHPHYLVAWHKDHRPWNEILAPGIPLAQIVPEAAGRAEGSVHIGRLYELEMTANYIGATELVARRCALPGGRWFPEDLATYEDWECFGRLTRAGLGAYLDRDTGINHGHSGPRVTDAKELAMATSRIAVLERVWGADEAYQRAHGAEYRAVLEEQRAKRIRALLAERRPREAREEIARAQHAPASYRILSHLPRILVGAMLAARALLIMLAGIDAG